MCPGPHRSLTNAEVYCMTDTPTDLRERLQNRLEQKTQVQDESTDAKEMNEDEDEDEDEDDDMEMDADMSESAEEAAQMLAEAAGVEPGQVVEMISPLFGEDTTDHPQEMAADTDELREVAREAAVAAVDERLPDDDEIVTESDLDGVVDALADQTRDVMSKASTGSTPTPTTGGRDRTTTKADLFASESGGED